MILNSYTEYIQKSSILVPGIKTDHQCIEIKLNFSETCRGPGRWKLNVNILKDKPYIDFLKDLIKNVKEKILVHFQSKCYGSSAKLKLKKKLSVIVNRNQK